MGIFPEKIPKAGQISICCFDKTGTLTLPNMILHKVLKNDNLEV